jgi:hypothetical protein
MGGAGLWGSSSSGAGRGRDKPWACSYKARFGELAGSRW